MNITGPFLRTQSHGSEHQRRDTIEMRRKGVIKRRGSQEQGGVPSGNGACTDKAENKGKSSASTSERNRGKERKNQPDGVKASGTSEKELRYVDTDAIRIAGGEVQHSAREGKKRHHRYAEKLEMERGKKSFRNLLRRNNTGTRRAGFNHNQIVNT